MNGINRGILWVAVGLACSAVFWGSAPVRAAGQGNGGPAVTLTPSTLSFPSQVATTTSAAQMVTLTNVGGQPLTISSIMLQGTFSQTNTCPTSGSLAAGSSCTFSVTFVAPNAGRPTVQPGFIEITDDATPNLQVINLSGTVADFGFTASPTSATVSAGSSVSYQITVTPSGGFDQAITFNCGALPTGASCSFSPNSVAPGGPVTLTVSTTAASVLMPLLRGLPFITTGVMFLSSLLFGTLLWIRLRARARSKLTVVAGACGALVLLGAFGMVSCGGGGSSSGGGGSVATPAGTYSVLITGSPTAGPSSLANPLVVMMVVQ